MLPAQAQVGKLTDDTQKKGGAIYVNYVKKAVEKVSRLASSLMHLIQPHSNVLLSPKKSSLDAGQYRVYSLSDFATAGLVPG